MPMTELRVGDQTVRYDREATAAIYAGLKPSFRALLEQLGVDPNNKEAEAFECIPVESGCHLCGGWFYFVGEVVAWGERNCIAPRCRTASKDTRPH